MKLFGDAYRGRRVLLTGHTGFKGSWLAYWLTQLGADVTGIALAPQTTPSHWDLLGLDIEEHRLDIRDERALADAVAAARPEIVFHLAAQPLVRRSYREPLETWSTNVMGTANLLESCRSIESVRAVLVVTSDKCYENQEWLWGYRESDKLGGHDPYSASKAATEILVASYRASFMSGADAPLIASARAGNVIGGGDWSEDRLIPDIFRAVQAKASLEIRSPHATRPWQHVLESLSGYLLLGQKLLNREHGFDEAWNFGPDQAGNQPVGVVMKRIAALWPELKWHITDSTHAHEAKLLYLDSAKARASLAWEPVWGLDDALANTIDWYQTYLSTSDIRTPYQLEDYLRTAAQAGASWCQP